MTVRSRWRREPHVHCRRLGHSVVAYHAGSGDTHLLNTLSGAILEILAEAPAASGLDVCEIGARRDLEATEDELFEALTTLADAGIVRSDPGP